jgi:hypothetical protein
MYIVFIKKMKKFVFPKYLKYVSSISEWSSSIYTFNKKNLFLLNNNEKKAYELLYHYFSSNISFNKATNNIKLVNLKSIYNSYFSKFILSKFYFIINKLNFFFIERNNFLFFSYTENLEKEKILIKKT